MRNAIADMWSAADTAVEQALKKVPAGVYTASSFLDDDGGYWYVMRPSGQIVRP